MKLQVVLLRVMLWSLGVSAVTGVLAVLLQGGELAWKVVGTGFITALACGLLLPASAMVDQEKSRAGGLLGMAAVILEFLMAMMLIWEAPRHLWGVSWEEEIALTMLFFGMATVAIIALLALLREPYGMIAGRVGAILTIPTFVVLMIAIWTPHRAFGENWWETGASLALFGGLAVLNLINLGTGDRRHWRWCGVAASIGTCSMWLYHIWIGTGTDLGYVIFCTLTGLATVSAHANLLLVCTLKPGQNWVRGGTIAAAILTAVMIDLIIVERRFGSIGVGFDRLNRVAAAAGIVTACGTLALCVLFRMNRKVDFEPMSTERMEMSVACPRCGKKQVIPLGDSVCTGCKLRISIRIEEPRCPQCDYLLYRLESDRCPECGTVLADC